jgi:hypothetical protein
MSKRIYLRTLAGTEPQLFVLAVLDSRGSTLRVKSLRSVQAVRNELSESRSAAEIEQLLSEALSADPL